VLTSSSDTVIGHTTGISENCLAQDSDTD
jgi:hypothetical protein